MIVLLGGFSGSVGWPVLRDRLSVAAGFVSYLVIVLILVLLGKL